MSEEFSEIQLVQRFRTDAAAVFESLLGPNRETVPLPSDLFDVKKKGAIRPGDGFTAVERQEEKIYSGRVLELDQNQLIVLGLSPENRVILELAPLPDEGTHLSLFHIGVSRKQQSRIESAWRRQLARIKAEIDQEAQHVIRNERNEVL